MEEQKHWNSRMETMSGATLHEIQDRYNEIDQTEGMSSTATQLFPAGNNAVGGKVVRAYDAVFYIKVR